MHSPIAEADGPVYRLGRPRQFQVRCLLNADRAVHPVAITHQTDWPQQQADRIRRTRSTPRATTQARAALRLAPHLLGGAARPREHGRDAHSQPAPRQQPGPRPRAAHH